MKRVVFGLGRSGKAALKLLSREEGELFAIDRTLHNIEGVSCFTEENFPLGLAVDEVILSPGIPQSHPLVNRLKREGAEVMGEMEMALRRTFQPCIGITGTNGKTSATYLLTHLLQQGGKKARALGNCGTPLSAYLLHPDREEILCLEMSSFQTETLQTRKLDWAILLPITPDHLDRYASFDEYAKAKCQIKSAIKKSGKLLLFEETKKKFEKYLAEVETITLREHCDNIVERLVKELGIEVQKEAFVSFKRPEHRLEEVALFQGVRFINDSKATNIDATLHALRALPEDLLIILGGRDKGSDFSRLIKPLKERVKKVYLYGEAAEKIKRELEGVLTQTGSFEEMIKQAASDAKEGESVLFSPACASFDLFENFEKRGEAFKQIVKQLVMPS